jgi:hypothetical protein
MNRDKKRRGALISEHPQWPEPSKQRSPYTHGSWQNESPPSGHLRGSREMPPEKKSWMDYVNVTSGSVSALFAVIGVLVALWAAHVIGPKSPSGRTPAPGISPNPGNAPHPAPGRTTTQASSVVPVTTQRLQHALLNVGIFTPPASIITTANSPSQLESICGASLQGANFASFEDIQFDNQGMDFKESIVAWPSASAAAASIGSLRPALDSSGCQLGSTSYSGDSTGLAPTSCQQAGQYLATGATTSGGTFQYVGEVSTVQCGAIVFWIQITGDLPAYPDQGTADRYLGMAIDKFNTTTS